MEACALANALRRLDERPARCVLAVNISPSVLGSAALRAVLPHDLIGVEIELTEHEAVLDTDDLRRELDRLRDRGARVAIDDVGAGHSGLRRMMELVPDSLKLDRHLVDGVSGSTAKAALIRAVVNFADHLGAVVCAEGVETVADALALADLDVDLAQGWAIGPAQAGFGGADPQVVAACGRSMQRVLSTPPDRLDEDGHRHPGTLEDLLGQLADVRDLDGLAELARAGAPVLPCDKVELSFLHADGSAVESLVGQAGHGDGTRYGLTDYPATRQCLQRRVVVPVYGSPRRGRRRAPAAARARLRQRAAGAGQQPGPHGRAAGVLPARGHAVVAPADPLRPAAGLGARPGAGRAARAGRPAGLSRSASPLTATLSCRRAALLQLPRHAVAVQHGPGTAPRRTPRGRARRCPSRPPPPAAPTPPPG